MMALGKVKPTRDGICSQSCLPALPSGTGTRHHWVPAAPGRVDRARPPPDSAQVGRLPGTAPKQQHRNWTSPTLVSQNYMTKLTALVA